MIECCVYTGVRWHPQGPLHKTFVGDISGWIKRVFSDIWNGLGVLSFKAVCYFTVEALTEKIEETIMAKIFINDFTVFGCAAVAVLSYKIVTILDSESSVPARAMPINDAKTPKGLGINLFLATYHPCGDLVACLGGGIERDMLGLNIFNGHLYSGICS